MIERPERNADYIDINVNGDHGIAEIRNINRERGRRYKHKRQMHIYACTCKRTS